jgi:hypothetical protein
VKIFNVKQGTASWLESRLGVPTASEFKQLFTPSMEPRKRGSAMPETYLNSKLAEIWDGPQGVFGSAATEHGKILEEEARPWFAAMQDVDISTPGFILSDCGRLGCSPDGLIGTLEPYGLEVVTGHQLLLPNADAYGLEIKCLQGTKHNEVIRCDGLHEDYAAQVHGSMLVTGLSHWTFLAYHRNIPKRIIRVERDEKIMRVMRERLDEFIAELDRAHKRLCEMNDGPPERQPLTEDQQQEEPTE